MKGQVVWIEKRYYSDGAMFESGIASWEIHDEEPEDWEKELFDKVVIIPLED